jgi:hypothetical protein
VQSIAGEFPPEALGEVRGRCIVEGYESLAVVPLRGGDNAPVGALHLADRAPNKFEAWIDLLEALSGACGPLLTRHEEREMELVGALQAALAPGELPFVPGLEFALAFSSATESASWAATFYDLRGGPR